MYVSAEVVGSGQEMIIRGRARMEMGKVVEGWFTVELNLSILSWIV